MLCVAARTSQLWLWVDDGGIRVVDGSVEGLVRPRAFGGVVSGARDVVRGRILLVEESVEVLVDERLVVGVSRLALALGAPRRARSPVSPGRSEGGIVDEPGGEGGRRHGPEVGPVEFVGSEEREIREPGSAPAFREDEAWVAKGGFTITSIF